MNRYIKNCYFNCDGFDSVCSSYREHSYDNNMCVWQIYAQNEHAKNKALFEQNSALEDIAMLDPVIHDGDGTDVKERKETKITRRISI